MTYLDYNATAPLKPAIRDAMLAAMEQTGNASSVHAYGRAARAAIEAAREEVANLVNVKPAQVIFTGGGTEANNLALRGTNRTQFIISAIEHDSIFASAPEAKKIAATYDGILDVSCARELIGATQNALVSVMLVNNETGVIQPVPEIAELAKASGALVHTDAIQAAGRMPLDFAALGVDMMTLSAHKIAGPQGVGALVVREGLPLEPLVRGGGQEMRRRAGTENVAAIAGFGVAARLAATDILRAPLLGEWRTKMERELQAIAKDCVIIGGPAPRVMNTSCIAMPGVESETQVMALDLAGVAVSAGSACSSGKVKASHVLKAMGYDDKIAGCAIRISMGWATAESDINRLVRAWESLYRRTRNRQAA